MGDRSMISSDNNTKTSLEKENSFIWYNVEQSYPLFTNHY